MSYVMCLLFGAAVWAKGPPSTHHVAVAKLAPLREEKLVSTIQRSATIAHKEILFLLARVSLQTSISVFNPNNLLGFALTSVIKFLTDVVFQYVSFLYYKDAIHNSYGTGAAAGSTAGKVEAKWGQQMAGFVTIRTIQRLTFLSAFYLFYYLLVGCTHLNLHFNVLNLSYLAPFGYDIGNFVMLNSAVTILGAFAFRKLWDLAINLTIADKVYMWNIGLSGKKETRQLTVGESLALSPVLVKKLGVVGLINRLVVTYLIPRFVVSGLGVPEITPFFNAYFDILMMIASHLCFLDRKALL